MSGGAVRRYLVTGASRGLGKALADGLPGSSDRAILAARRPPADEPRPGRRWVACDLSRLPESVDALAAAVGDEPLDVLVCNVGIWEAAAFGPGYRFESSSDAEIRTLLDVNVASTLLLVRRLLPALRRSDNPKIIVIGSISGLDNAGSREVAFAASKFAQRGLVHALREELRPDRIGVCLVNPGYMATEEVLGDVGPGGEDRTLPLEDIIALIRTVVSTSRRTCVKQIDVPAMLDRE